MKQRFRHTLIILLFLTASVLPMTPVIAAEELTTPLLLEVRDNLKQQKTIPASDTALLPQLLAGNYSTIQKSEYSSSSQENIAILLLSYLKSAKYSEFNSTLEELHYSEEFKLDTVKITSPELEYTILKYFDAVDNLEVIAAHASQQPENLSIAQHLSLGYYFLRIHQPERALDIFNEVSSTQSTEIIHFEALAGKSSALYKLGEYYKMLEVCESALVQGIVYDDLLFQTGLALIRLGRVHEATAIFQLTLKANPYHEKAHYFLGNGYTPQNYTQFKRANSEAFPDSTAQFYWNIALEQLDRHHFTNAKRTFLAIRSTYPRMIDAPIYLASLEFWKGDIEEAGFYASEAWKQYPEYGRANAILAKVFEMRRLRSSEVRQKLEAQFDRTTIPNIPTVEQYVINWKDLSDRHRKRVALSLQPWANYIPILAATGHTLYIKPIHEKLSDSPHLAMLSNMRINLDSRLWDDVRGVGGFHTVTGIEDVERTIFGGYDTVLHEVTHQVHGILDTADKQRLEDAYQRALAEEKKGKSVFLSRYQGSTVWEYFAEGVNGYYSPMWGEFDEREVVQERLITRDSTLVAIVTEFTQRSDLKHLTQNGYQNAISQKLEEGNAQTALTLLNRIPEEKRLTPELQNTASFIYSILEDKANARYHAEQALELDPDNVNAYIQLANVYRQQALPFDEQIEMLQKGLSRFSDGDAFELLIVLGEFYSAAGKYTQAYEYYSQALGLRPQAPDAHWGVAKVLGDSSISRGRVTSLLARSTQHFEDVIKMRSGVLKLRLDFARILLQHGELAKAKKQIKEAEFLNSEAPEVRAYMAWYLSESGETARSQSIIADLDTSNNYSDDVLILAKSISKDKNNNTFSTELEQRISNPPSWRYNPTTASYEAVGIYEPWQRDLLKSNGFQI
ncbi:tetratricopeptide repeat protein [bacterium]|nr:tetratricopeptide repeat protein [bacterium]